MRSPVPMRASSAAVAKVSSVESAVTGMLAMLASTHCSARVALTAITVSSISPAVHFRPHSAVSMARINSAGLSVKRVVALRGS